MAAATARRRVCTVGRVIRYVSTSDAITTAATLRSIEATALLLLGRLGGHPQALRQDADEFFLDFVLLLQ